MVKGMASAGVSGTPRVLIILSPRIIGAGPEDEEVNRVNVSNLGGCWSEQLPLQVTR